MGCTLRVLRVQYPYTLENHSTTITYTDSVVTFILGGLLGLSVVIIIVLLITVVTLAAKRRGKDNITHGHQCE